MKNLLEFLSRHYHWFLFAFLEVISVVLLFSYNRYQASVWVSSTNVMTGKIYETTSGIEQFFSLVKRNEQLTQRNLYLEQQLQAVSSQLCKQANDSSFMQMAGVKLLEHYHIIPAKVISNSIDKKDNLITINKGEADGIKKDMAVACGTGVVGIVYLTNEHYSIVIPVLNSQSSISCMIQDRGYFGHLRWYNKNPRYAFLEDIPRHARFNLYDKVVTSGYSSMFPEGIMVGKIIHVYNSADGISYRCMVELSTDFSRLSDVCAIDDTLMRERLKILHAAQDSLGIKQ